MASGFEHVIYRLYIQCIETVYDLSQLEPRIRFRNVRTRAVEHLNARFGVISITGFHLPNKLLVEWSPRDTWVPEPFTITMDGAADCAIKIEH